RVLGELRKALERYRATPARLALRGVLQTCRAVGGLRAPPGLVVALVGPDGVGKSTLADALEREVLGAFMRTDRRHVGPGLLPPPARLLGRKPPDHTDPHGHTLSGPVESGVRPIYLLVDWAVGWLPRIALPR